MVLLFRCLYYLEQDFIHEFFYKNNWNRHYYLYLFEGASTKRKRIEHYQLHSTIELFMPNNSPINKIPHFFKEIFR